LKRVAEDTPRPIREIIPEVPQWLCDVIARLHAKKPEDRFGSAQEVADLLSQYLAGLQLHGKVDTGIEVRKPLDNETDSNTIAFHPALPGSSALAPANVRSGRRRLVIAAAIVLPAVAGLTLSEAVGVSKIHPAILRMFSANCPLVAETSDRHDVVLPALGDFD